MRTLFLQEMPTKFYSKIMPTISSKKNAYRISKEIVPFFYRVVGRQNLNTLVSKNSNKVVKISAPNHVYQPKSEILQNTYVPTSSIFSVD